jgi:hypothetical protein
MSTFRLILYTVHLVLLLIQEMVAAKAAADAKVLHIHINYITLVITCTYMS